MAYQKQGLQLTMKIDMEPLKEAIRNVQIAEEWMARVSEQIILTVAQQRVPVDTGYLWSTLEAKGSKNEFWVEAGAPYAAFQEFGTSYVRAQPYLRPGFEAWWARRESLMRQAMGVMGLSMGSSFTSSRSQAFKAGGGGA